MGEKHFMEKKKKKQTISKIDVFLEAVYENQTNI